MNKYINQINQICVNGSKKYGLQFDIPIEFSGQMKTTYGYVRYAINRQEGTYTPIKMKFAKFLLDEENHEEFIDTILHELAHFIVAKLYPTVNHGHDEVWQEIATELGCRPERFANSKNLGNPPKPKYVVSCCKCNKKINYYKKSKVVKNITNYNCRCGGELELL